MQSKINGEKVIGEMAWRFAERMGAKGVSFIVSIVLARLLLPEVYGHVALVTVIINILEVFVDSGMGVALIQKKDADDLDFSSVFYFNLASCTLLYLIMFLGAPLIADFYEYSELTPVIRVLSLSLIISGIKNVQQAYVSRNMQFKKFFFSTIIGTIGAAIIGITLAYFGAGIWALVAQQLFNMTLDTVILWITVKWKPQLTFSYSRLKSLYSYGSKLLLSKLIDTIYGELEQLIIGKVYNSSSLAYYNRARTFPQMLVLNVNSSIDSVLLPAMSSEQDDKKRVKAMTRRSIQVSAYVISPMMIGLFVIAPSLIEIVLTENWLPCVPYVQVFCIAYLFYPINTANLNAIRAVGRSDLYLKLDIIKKIIGVIVLLIALKFGPLAMAFSYLISSMIGQLINSAPNKRLLNYTYIEQLKDVLPSIWASGLMGIFIYLLNFLHFNVFYIMLLQILLGIVIYIGISIVVKMNAFCYLLELLNSFFARKNRK